MNRIGFAAVAALVLGAAGTSQAAIIANGVYNLHNHPDGSAQPPRYGLRLDELYNVNPTGHDIFTFDFDDARSNVTMTVSPGMISITGSAWGGRDTGTGYAAALQGLYSFNFVYNVGVANHPSDDDIWVVADLQNFGSITTPTGDVIPLVDKSDGNYSFRLGDENNDLGHRGFNGISGWGWLNHGPVGSPHVSASDWLFTATLVPAPSTLALVGLGGVLVGRRRR
jgi:hypothetical protein